MLTKFVRNAFKPGAEFDMIGFADAVADQVRFLDNVLDVTFWPLKEQSDESQAKRRIGVGYTGLGDALIMLGAYFSPSWTVFQADRGRCFSVIVDGISN